MNDLYSSRRWNVLLRLMTIGIFYQLQHYILSFIAAGSSILADLNISNFEYSLLSGPCTLIITALSTMPLSRLGDYTTRPIFFLIITSSLSALLTTCNSFAANFWTLLWPRMLFSVASSPISPLNLRVLTTFFSIEHRGTTSSLYFLTVYIGLSLCSAFLYISYLIGWRLTYVVVGLGSLAFSIISLLGVTRLKTSSFPSTVSSDVKTLFSNRTLVYCVIGLSFKYINQFVRATFESIYFARMFPDSIGIYSFLNTGFILLSPISAILLGKVTDSLESRFVNIKAVLCAVSLVLPMPLMVFMYWTDDFIVAMVLLGVSSLFSEAYIGVSYAIMINVTLPRVKAFQSAWMMSVTMMAGGVVVTVIGYFYSTLLDLRIALISAAVGPLSLATLMFVMVAKVYRKDLEEFLVKIDVYKDMINESI